MERRRHDLLPILVVALVVAAVAWRASTLLRYDLWYDELYSVFAALGDLGQLWQSAVDDRVHPPLFYVTLWGWLKLVDPTPVMLRLLPLGIFVLGIAATWWAAVAAGFTTRGRAVAALAVALNPIAFEAGADLRGYSLLLTLTAVLIATTYQRFQPAPSNRSLALLIAAAVAATWTHYFAWPTVVAIALILILHHRRRDALLLMGVTIACTLPWFFALVTAPGARLAGQLAWGIGPGWMDVLRFPGLLLADRTPAPIRTGAAVVGWILLATALRTAAGRDRLLLIAAPVSAMLLGGLVLSVGIWDPRYLITAVVPLALCIATSTESSQRAQQLGVVVVLALSAWGAVTPNSWRPRWRNITHELASRTPAEPVYAFDGFTALPIRYYAQMEGLELSVPEVKQWPDASTPSGWLLLRPSIFPERPSPAERLRNAGRTVTDSIVDRGIEAWRFR